MSAASSAEPSTRRSELNNLSWYCWTKRPKAAESPAKVAAMSEASSLKLGSWFWTLVGRIKFPAAWRDYGAVFRPKDYCFGRGGGCQTAETRRHGEFSCHS